MTTAGTPLQHRPRQRISAAAARFQALALASLLLVGCASGGQSTADEATPGDPIESVNRAVYGFNRAVDRAVVRPVAVAYQTVMPRPANIAVSNFFANLGDVRNAANNLLQGKLTRAYDDVGRVSINSTFGLGGLIDIASAVGIPKHHEDFGQTLGVWGVPTGPYLVLPLLGPSSARNLPGRIVDAVTDPRILIDSTGTTVALRAVELVDTRAALLEREKLLDEAATIDEYSFVRDAYTQRRRSLVYDGDPPLEDFDFEEDG